MAKRPAPRRHFDVHTYTPEEVNQLVSTCSRRAPTGVRNAALIMLLYRTGVRISEALAIRPTDLDRGRRAITVQWGKGGKRRVVGMDEPGWIPLERWLDHRRARDVPRGAPVFCTLAGGQLADEYVRQMLHRRAERAGIEKRVNPHGFRHTHATELLREGKPLRVIQGQLGHAYISTTARYLHGIDPEEVLRETTDRSQTHARQRLERLLTLTDEQLAALLG